MDVKNGQNEEQPETQVRLIDETCGYRGTNTSLRSNILGGAQRECKPNLKIAQENKNLFELGPAIWKDTRRHVWKDTAIWQTRRSNNYTKSPRRVWMIINSKEKLEAVGKSVFTYRSDMFLFSSHRQA